MKQLLIAICFLMLGVSALAGIRDTTSATIDSLGTNSSAVDLWSGGQADLLGIGFPATVTSDTVFIQGRWSTTGAWKDIYYLSSSGEKIRAHVVVDTGDIVLIHPLMIFGVPRYIRIVSDDAEADDRVFTIYKGKY